MNTQRVKELIAAPSSVTAEDRPGLVGLVERYPHVSGLALLLARASQLAGHIDQQRDLLRAAAMLEQRDALFDLMVRPEILKEAREQWEKTDGRGEIREAGGEKLETGTDGRGEIREAGGGKLETGTDGRGEIREAGGRKLETGTGTKAELRSETGTEVETGGELSSPTDVEGEVQKGEAEMTEMEREVLLSAIESTIERDVMEWEKQETGGEIQEAGDEIGDRGGEKLETGTETGTGTGGELRSPTDGGSEIRDGGTEGELRSQTDGVYEGQGTYSAWLRVRARAVEFGTAGQPEPVSVPESVSVPEPVPVPEPVKDVGVLIDRFLEVQPKIGPMREVDKKVEESARMSILEDDTLVTETMARVFAKQGQIGRARKIYKQLALKYPAKSTYFAAQLKKLGKGS